ncbi:MAG: exo-alpha-sialidase [Planctomycetaceae bacterium]|nr:exo-alpha-sialidase [Planctomycetaceae bacterium]
MSSNSESTVSHPTRRRFLQATAATAAGCCLLRRASGAAPAINVIETKVISVEPHLYHGWPTLAQRTDGELLLVWSGGREAHVCPFGRVDWMRSTDEGKTWTWPRTLIDGPSDDRDAGVVETADGSILVTTFTSVAWESVFAKSVDRDDDRHHRWEAAAARLTPEERQAELGTWMIRSTDGGINWSERYRVPVNSPHGPVRLDDGRLLYAGKQLWEAVARVGVSISSDDGVSWGAVIEIPAREGDDFNNYHELHAVQAGDGRIIVQIRNHNSRNERETLQTHSDDGGQTWVVPYSIGVWGLPSHLLRLRDDRLLMTYGHRRAPLGNQARVSDDGGRTWSDPVNVSGDGASGDLGYPSTVELSDGSLLSVWYEKLADSPQAVLRQARWRLEG